MRCPHCGNKNPNLILNNGCRPSDPDYTLLCLAPLKAEDSSFDVDVLRRLGYIDENGMTQCGMQWEPNSAVRVALDPDNA